MCTTMKVLKTALTLCLIFAAEETLGHNPSTCTAKYSGQSPTHTMCLTTPAVNLTQEVKDQIISLHNDIRRNVTNATNMMKMKWDDRLAAVAEMWAMQCKGGHDANRKEPDLPGIVGQNVARNTITNTGADFAWAVMSWASEISKFHYGKWEWESKHYIQQISYSAALVGCGQSICGRSNHFVCNYYSGTMNSVPYNNGTSCGGCPHSCNNGLCDCTSGPDACFNGGTINIDNCTCQCDTYWTGDLCQTADCPREDYTQECATVNTALCSKRHFYRNTCPYRCGICQLVEINGTTTPCASDLNHNACLPLS